MLFKRKQTLEDNFYKICKKGIREKGYSDVPLEMADNIFSKLKKKNRDIINVELGEKISLLISPKKIKKKKLEFIIRDIHNVNSYTYLKNTVNIYVENPNYMFQIIRAFRDISECIVIEDTFNIERRILGKYIEGEELSDGEKLLLLIDFPDMKL